MSDLIAVIAEFHLKPEHHDQGVATLRGLIEPSRNDKGCVYYDLFKDHDKENTYIMMETWASREEWHEHCNQAFLKEAQKECQPCLAEPVIVRSFNIDQ